LTDARHALSRHVDGSPRSVLSVGIPAVGHLNPLLRQACELQRRGWRVALASTTGMRQYVAREFPTVRFVDLGPDPIGGVGNAELQARVSANASFLGGTIDILRSVNALWPMMFAGLADELRRDRPDVMVVDLFTAAGMDAAEDHGVPYVVNNPDLLTAISADLLPAAPEVPLLFSGRSISRITALDRVLNPVFRALASAVFDLTLGADLNRLRRARRLRPRRMTRRLAGVLIMTNSAFGLEYNRPVPPLLQMVGPMLDEPRPDALTDSLRDWLDSGPPVVFVNLGTLARPGADIVDRIAHALVSSEFRALWVLREVAPTSLPPSVRIEPWVSSQVSVLAHPNVHVFVSHCGVNSVHESLFAGTPIVGVPMLADQRDMAMRVQDAGTGVALDKRTLTAAALQQAIVTVLKEPRFARNIVPIQSSFVLAGGVRRAADLIEHAAAVGVDHYATGWWAD
jgi:UDP:flavonoid glycosyltransferase YjiC (YdhE family)